MGSAFLEIKIKVPTKQNEEKLKQHIQFTRNCVYKYLLSNQYSWVTYNIVTK